MSKRILLVGGGSGGHFFPLVAVAQSLRKLDPASELMILGEGQFFTNTIGSLSIRGKRIIAGKLRRYFSFWTILDPFKAVIGFFQSLWILFWYMPDLVFTKGGAVSIMPVLVARLYAIPVYTHESDSVPGMANRFIGKFAKTVFTSFDDTTKYFKTGKVVLVGNPIREELLTASRDAALQKFNFRADKKTILIAGGSQGSKHINEAILGAIIQIIQQFQVIHQCGDSQLPIVRREIDRLEKEGSASYGPVISANYRLYPFLSVNDMALAYAVADVVISRGGASNIFEIAALGKPVIIIPITHSSGNHQFQNALEMTDYGAVMIEEANLTPHIIINQIQELLEPSRYAAASAKIKTFAKPDAADTIAGMLLR